jgi:molybdopterin-containing oxidoreductase family molybdopterin binding subunit
MLKKSKFTRRGFIKAATALGAAAALAGCSGGSDESVIIVGGGQTDSPPEDKRISSICRANCFNGCHLWAYTRNKRVVKTAMAPLEDERYNRVCLRGLSHIQQLYSPGRVLYPLKRKPGTERGAGEWISIDWPTAVKEIAEGIKKVITGTDAQRHETDYEGRAMAYLEGSGNYGGISGVSGLINRLFAHMRGTYIQSALDAAMSFAPGNVIGKGRANEYADLINAKTIVAWGTNVAESQIHNWHFIADAAARAKNFVSVDIMYNSTAARADKFINVIPGSDVALMLSLIHVCMDNFIKFGTYCDEEYMVKNTEAPFLVRQDTGKYLRGSEVSGGGSNALAAMKADGSTLQYAVVDTTSFTSTSGTAINYQELPDGTGKDKAAGGTNYTGVYKLTGSYTVTLADSSTVTVKPAFQHMWDERFHLWTPAHQKQFTGVDETVVEEFADMIANDGPTAFYTGYGLDRYWNAHHGTHSLSILAGLTGNLALPGNGLSLFWDYPTFLSSPAAPTSGRTTTSMVYPLFPTVFNSDASSMIFDNGGPNEMFHISGRAAAIDYPIRGMYVAFANPVGCFTDAGNLIKNVLLHKNGNTDSDMGYKLQLLVVADPRMSDTAQYADYLLPAAHYFEVEDFGACNNNCHVHYQEKAVEPMGDSLGDADIARMLAFALANALGDDSYYNEFRYTNEEFLDRCFDNNVYGIWWKSVTGEDLPADRRITWDKLKEKQSIRFYPGTPFDNYKTPNRRIKAANSIDWVAFPTNTGKLRVYLEAPIYRVHYGQFGETGSVITDADIKARESIPDFEMPLEAWQGAIIDETRPSARTVSQAVLKAARAQYRSEHPYVLVQEHSRWRVHTQWAETPWLRELDPEPVVKINELDAESIGVANGDYVRISNTRGKVIAKVVITKGIRRGSVNAPKGWLTRQFKKDPIDGHQGNLQELLNIEVHPVCVNQAFSDALVKIERVTGVE